MKQIKSPAAALSIKVIIILSAALAAGIFLVEDKQAYALGIAFGGVFTVLKTVLMERTIAKAVEKPPQAAKNYANAHYMLRYVLTFLVLFVGIASPHLHPIGVALGLLALKPAAYWQGRSEPPSPKDGSVEWLEWEDDDEENSDF